jgi:hypothetical protein
MSRKTIYKDERFTVVGGDDHAVGKFLQVFDKELENETPEGEGLILDWSELFGMETNLTGEPTSLGAQVIIDKLINASK